ncbi:putative malate dehydrogenase (decarboxylating) [Helianthus annuus]|nr:putative malate dehydrogenase (decarboxylating) [Helianthus annuus]
MWRRSVSRSALTLRQSRRLSICASTTPIPAPSIIHKRGADILHDPWFNKVRSDHFSFLIQLLSNLLTSSACYQVINLRTYGSCLWSNSSVVIVFQEQDTGFPMTERDRLGLRGLLPPRVISFEQQYDRFSQFFYSSIHLFSHQGCLA